MSEAQSDRAIVTIPKGEMKISSGLLHRGLSLIDTFDSRQSLPGLNSIAIHNIHQDGISCVAFSSDGQFFATSSWDNSICVWDIQCRKIVRRINLHRGKIRKIAFLRGREWLVSVGDDKLMFVWDFENNHPIGHLDDINILAISDDGHWAVCTDTGMCIRLVNIDHFEKDSIFGFNVFRIQTAGIATGNSIVVTGGQDGSIVEWDLLNRKFINHQGHEDWIWNITFNDDGSKFLVSSADGIISMHQVNNINCVYKFIGHEKSVYSAVFASDERYIISASADKTLRLWNVETQEPVNIIHLESEVISMAKSQVNGMVITGSLNGKVILWAVE